MQDSPSDPEAYFRALEALLDLPPHSIRRTWDDESPEEERELNDDATRKLLGEGASRPLFCGASGHSLDEKERTTS